MLLSLPCYAMLCYAMLCYAISRDFTLLSEPAYLSPASFQSLLQPQPQPQPQLSSSSSRGASASASASADPAAMTTTIIIPPVVNLTEEEKKRLGAAFIGKMFKQGHGVKTWKERLVLIADSRLQYFDMKMNFKGEFVTEDCTVDTGYTTATGLPSSASSAFPFQIKSYAAGGQFLNCYVTASHMRDLFQLALETRSSHMEAVKQLVSIPAMKTGWLLKQGHVIRNWKKRFFVLNYGELSYYEHDGIAGSGAAEGAKGKVELKGAAVIAMVEENGKNIIKASAESELRMMITDSHGDKLIVQAGTRDEKKEWFDALKRHVLYANDYCD
jgi:hypothetical protein